MKLQMIWEEAEIEVETNSEHRFAGFGHFRCREECPSIVFSIISYTMTFVVAWCLVVIEFQWLCTGNDAKGRTRLSKL